jgi:hypothetical protein
MAQKKTVQANPFDSLAKKPAAKKSSSPKVLAVVTPEVRKAVDDFNSIHAEIKRKESELKTQAAIISACIDPQQDDLARAGAFTKSMYVEGDVGAATYSRADSFSVTGLNAQDTGAALQETVRNLIGEEKYNAWFQMKRTVKLQDSVNKNPEMVAKICGAIQKAGLDLSVVFEVTDAIGHCDDLDRKQYELDADTLPEFRALVPWRAPAIKPVVKS